MRRRLLAVLGRLALLAFSLLFALVLGEIGLRVVGAAKGIDYRLYPREMRVNRLPDGLFAKPPRSYPAFQPGASLAATTSEYTVVYTINGKGLRDGEHAYARTPDKRRIVALGDSFTFGQGVDYGARYTEVAEAHLGDVEIVNMGVPGYGLDEALMAFLIEGRKYQPEVVVVFLNGPMANRQNVDFAVVDGRVRLPEGLTSRLDETAPNRETLYLAPTDPFFLQQPSWLERESYLFAFASYRLSLWRLHEVLRQSDASYWKTPVGPERPPTPVRDARRVERTTLVLQALRDVCTEIGAELIVVNIDAQQRFDHVRDIPGLTYVDLADELSSRSRKQNLRFTYDRHYNPDTHAFIGERLGEILQQRP